MLTSGIQRDFNSAANRACDNQFNQCAAIANRKGGNFEVGDCDKQNCEFVERETLPCWVSVKDDADETFYSRVQVGSPTATEQGVSSSGVCELDGRV